MQVDTVTIGTVVYPEGDGEKADDILRTVAQQLKAGAVRLAGAIQRNTENPQYCRCDMTLEDLAGGRLVDISEDLGPGSSGCRLNSAALEEIVGLVCASLDQGADLLIVNKFGKREAEGAGFRAAIEAALARNIAVLVAVNSGNQQAWEEFSGGLDVRLPLDPDAIIGWGLRSVNCGNPITSC